MLTNENPKENLLSVIVPFYNTDSTIQRCLESILTQTYGNIEIIVVNDGSKNKPSLPNSDKIKYVEHPKNRGLFMARITGFNASRGDYVAFVDSDDYVTPDYFRTMIKESEREDTEIVAGTTVFVKSNGAKFVRNLHEINFPTERIEGDAVRKQYFRQQGSCFVWHTIWNKIYKRELWNRVISFFENIDDKIVMCEDVLFSSILFFECNSFKYVPNEGYCYCENKSSSTNSSEGNYNKFKNNVISMTTVFDSVERYLNSHNAEAEIMSDFLEFRRLYSRMWRSYRNKYYPNTAYNKESESLIDNLCSGYDKESCGEEDHFFEFPKTPYCTTNYDIKNIIINPAHTVISFDVFDTLITRPFFRPEDLFLIMDEELSREAGPKQIKFSKLRVMAEEELRSEWYKIKPGSEDFTLSDIYSYLSDNFGVKKEYCEKAKKLEIESEKKFCKPRMAGLRLFELAIDLGKTVYITSDMYLEKETMEQILHSCGITGYKKLLLSSDLGCTKFSGKIYDCLIKESKVDPTSIVHIGDDWQKDFVNANSKKIVGIFFPKSQDVFKNKIGNVKTNSLGCLSDDVTPFFINKSVHEDCFAIRTMYKLISNRFFDNPYPSFNEASDFNCNARLLGYYAVGMHIEAIASWIYENVKDNDIKSAIFLSRDGYLVKKAFDIIARGNTTISSRYVHCSRRCLLPFMINVPSDMFDLPVEFRAHSEKSITKLLNFCLNVPDDSVITLDGKKFASRNDYNRFIRKIINEYYSQEKNDESRAIVREYYRRMIPPGSIVFDMGYSGRMAAALQTALGYSVKFRYVYKNPSAAEYESKYSLDIKTMYPVSPGSSGFIRESILSEQNNSAVGFERMENGIRPLLVNDQRDWIHCYPIFAIQENSLALVSDYECLFRDSDIAHNFNAAELSLPFESMIIKIKDFDRYIFRTFYEDDTAYGGIERVSLYSIWGQYLGQLYGKPSLKVEKIISNQKHSKFIRLYRKYRGLKKLIMDNFDI